MGLRNEWTERSEILAGFNRREAFWVGMSIASIVVAVLLVAGAVFSLYSTEAAIGGVVACLLATFLCGLKSDRVAKARNAFDNAPELPGRDSTSNC